MVSQAGHTLCDLTPKTLLRIISKRPHAHRFGSAGPLRRSGKTPAAAFLLVLICLTRAHASPGPENLLIVVNAKDSDSIAISEEYARLRQIPACNILLLDSVPKGPYVSADAFRNKILQPVLAAIRARDLDRQIDCIAYSTGFPFGINTSGDAEAAKVALPRHLAPMGSLTGLTYLYQTVLARDPAYHGLCTNFYSRLPRIATDGVDWNPAEQRLRAEADRAFKDAKALYRKIAAARRDKKDSGRWERQLVEQYRLARDCLLKLAETRGGSAGVQYNLACAHALLNEKEDALAALERAVEAGWWNAGHAESDPDLESLRGEVAYRDLLAAMRGKEIDLLPTAAFWHDRAWKPNGDVAGDGEGMRYMLSVMLAYVGGPRSNTLEESLAYLRRSVAADGSMPAGTVYYCRNANIRSRTREWGYAAAVRMLERESVAARIIDSVLPEGKNDVAGAMVGAASFNWAASGSKILPGAILEHLTSHGGIMSRGKGQTLLSEFLRHGAAGASGTVNEPMALQAKFPDPFIHLHYARGCCLAEAFYQSVSAPYQLLIVGDPLCRPWARIPRLTLSGIAPGQAVSGKLELALNFKQAKDMDLQQVEMYLDGVKRREFQPGEQLVLDTTILEAGEHELRVVARLSSLQLPARAIVSIRVP